jgi:uncharacterized Rossmann fold enzyme
MARKCAVPFFYGDVMLVGDFSLVCNTEDEIKARNAEINQTRNISKFSTKLPHDGKVCIIGGGPSLAECVDEIKARQLNGAKVWATNNTYRYLQANGVQADAHVILDARPDNAEFLVPDAGTLYFLNVSCDPSLFDKLEGCDVCIYDLGGAATGTTVGLKALYLAGFSGFAEFYLYGFDSSYRDTEHHAYSQPLNDGENVVEILVDDRKFRCAPWMAIQVEEFQAIARSFAEQDKIIHVAGDGMLPFVANRMMHCPKILTAVWDLQLCPTSYDFACFLGEAERRRIAISAETINLIIQPGPLKGFRDDDLPPNLGSREGMLYRVIVGMARLLPSIRDIEVLKYRRAVEADNLFPVDYRAHAPTIHYGHHYAQFATPVLRATAAAKQFVEHRYTKPYVTITLRESTHWPTRNSNRDAWERAAKWLTRHGYQVAWVPDAESPDANLFSYDVDMRLALYEGAVVNLGINNGPTMMMPYTQARYILFKMVTEGITWTSRDFHDKWGLKEGDQPGGRGRFIFAPDDYDMIIPELEQFFAIKEWPQPVQCNREIFAWT